MYYWGDTFETWVLGSDRAARIDPVADDLAVGLVHSFHSDSPVTEVNPLLYVRTAVTRLLYQFPDAPGPQQQLGADQCVKLEEALRGVTWNAAKHVMMQDTIGSLEKGKSADFVILDQDILIADLKKPVEGLPVVQETWLKGKRVDASPKKYT